MEKEQIIYTETERSDIRSLIKGNFTLDTGENEKNAYKLYGVTVAEGGYNDLLKFPSLKNVPFNDWAEMDGIEPDLSKPVLESKEVNIRFNCNRIDKQFGAFVEALTDGAYHTFYFHDLGKAFKLRLSKQPDINILQHLGVFSLQFADDFPTGKEDTSWIDEDAALEEAPGKEENETASPEKADGFTKEENEKPGLPSTGFELDGRDLAHYGICVLEGWATELKKSPDVKQKQLLGLSHLNGAIYDSGNVTFQSKDFQLNCALYAENTDDFWNCYHQLLSDLTVPGERALYIDAMGYEYKCFYKSCSVKNLYLREQILLEFTLTLTFTDFRIIDEEYFLAAENGYFITTEDNNFIDLKEYGIK